MWMMVCATLHAISLPTHPSDILRPDPFDAAAPVSVAEAARATQPAAAQPAAGHESHAAVYVCPMHPDVTSDKPGTCPKCGMELVKR